MVTLLKYCGLLEYLIQLLLNFTPVNVRQVYRALPQYLPN